jgi:hypothetical protein
MSSKFALATVIAFAGACADGHPPPPNRDGNDETAAAKQQAADVSGDEESQGGDDGGVEPDGSGSKPPQECTFANVSTKVVGAGLFHDCGELGPDAGVEAIQNAAICATASAAAETPFKFVFFGPGTDSYGRTSFYGVFDGPTFKVRKIEESTSGGGVIQWSVCEPFYRNAQCTNFGCLSCVDDLVKRCGCWQTAAYNGSYFCGLDD